MSKNITKEMIIADVMALDPELGNVFFSHGLHCFG